MKLCERFWLNSTAAGSVSNKLILLNHLLVWTWWLHSLIYQPKMANPLVFREVVRRRSSVSLASKTVMTENSDAQNKSRAAVDMAPVKECHLFRVLTVYHHKEFVHTFYVFRSIMIITRALKWLHIWSLSRLTSSNYCSHKPHCADDNYPPLTIFHEDTVTWTVNCLILNLYK